MVGNVQYTWLKANKPTMSPEVSQANHWMNWVCPNMCSLILLMYHSRTYWDHRHSDAHGCERRVGHRAALIGQPDAVVIAEESSLVRRDGRLVQKHGNKQHCMVGHTWAEVRQLFKAKQWAAASIDITNRKTKKRDIRRINSQETCIQVVYLFLFSEWEMRTWTKINT